METREPIITIGIGVRGGGKTYRTIQEVLTYQKVHQNRNVIFFDVNGESSYKPFKRIDANDIKKLKRVGTIRRVPPYHPKTGQAFDLDEKTAMCFFLLACVKHGLLVLEDLNNYMLGTNLKGFISKLTTNRHSDLDLFIHLQSVSAITPRLWQNCNYLRFHYTPENLGRIKQNLPDYDLLRLAQIMLEMYYQAGELRKFILIDVQRLKFIGIATNEESTTAPCELVQILPALFEKACAVHLDKPIQSKEVQAYIAKKMYYII
jgi:hypothetical protein